MKNHGCIRLYRAVSGCIGLYRALSGFIGLYRALSGCIRLYRAVSGCFGLYRAVSGCIELYQVVSGCIGLYHYVFLVSWKFSGHYICLARTLLRLIHPGWELTIQFISFTFDHPVLGQVNNIGHCILPLWPSAGISLGPTQRAIYSIYIIICLTF